jgi:hypothetical protein
MDLSRALDDLLPGLLGPAREADAEKRRLMGGYLTLRGIEPFPSEGPLVRCARFVVGSSPEVDVRPLAAIATLAFFSRAHPELGRPEVRQELARAARGLAAPVPAGLAFEVACRREDEGAALEAAARWRRSGARPRVRVLPGPEYRRRLEDGPFDVVVVSYLRDLKEDPRRFSYADAAWDLLLDALPPRMRAVPFAEGLPADAPVALLGEGYLYLLDGAGVLGALKSVGR